MSSARRPRYIFRVQRTESAHNAGSKNWEASMARSSKVDAEEQQGNKGTRPGPAGGSKNEVSHCTRLPRTNNEELGAKKQNPGRAAGDSSIRTKIQLEDFQHQSGHNRHGVKSQQARDQIHEFPHHVSTPPTVNEKLHADTEKQGKTASSEPTARGGGRALLRLRGSVDPILSKCDQRLPRLSLPRDKSKTITGAERRKDEQKVTLHERRALPGPYPTIKENWNLITVTKPVCRDDEERVALHGPRALPGPHPIIKENWNLIAITNPVRRDNEGKAGLHGPKPFPTPNPAANSFAARQRKAFDFDPLIRQEVRLPADPTAQKAEQSTRPDQIPLLPISYKPILTGRHPLHRPLPPIPDETYPEQDANCQPPPVPPHVVLHRRKALAMSTHDQFDSPLERCSSAPEAPVGTYFGRETLYSGWQPARAETVCSSYSDRYPAV